MVYTTIFTEIMINNNKFFGQINRIKQFEVITFKANLGYHNNNHVSKGDQKYLINVDLESSRLKLLARTNCTLIVSCIVLIASESILAVCEELYNVLLDCPAYESARFPPF